MNVKKIIGILAVVIFLAGAGYFISKNNNQTVVSPAPTPVPTVKSYSASEVATHASAASCWTIIDQKVYDLTAWISQHPGGQENILIICGRDGTAAFQGQHSNGRRANQILVNYQIGVLK